MLSVNENMVPHVDSHFLTVSDNSGRPSAFFQRRSERGVDQKDTSLPGISEPAEIAAEGFLWKHLTKLRITGCEKLLHSQDQGWTYKFHDLLKKDFDRLI